MIGVAIPMNKDLYCPYSILNEDIICEHKTARLERPSPVALHNHDGYELVLFLNGEANIFVESEEKRLERGNLIVIPPYHFHGIRVANVEKYERIVLNIRPAVLEKIGDSETDFTSKMVSNGKFNLIALTDTQLSDIISLLDSLEAALKDNAFGHSVLSRAYLTEFLVFLINHMEYHVAPEYQNSMSPIVKMIFRYIEKNICKNITVESLAYDLHHNSDYLSRIFKNATGGSLKYYINAKKIALAQQMLREGGQPYDVCFILGFNNYSSFSRCFTKHIGLSPKQYSMSQKGTSGPKISP